MGMQRGSLFGGLAAAILVVAALGLVGGLGLADADIFNQTRATASADRERTETEILARDHEMAAPHEAAEREAASRLTLARTENEIAVVEAQGQAALNDVTRQEQLAEQRQASQLKAVELWSGAGTVLMLFAGFLLVLTACYAIYRVVGVWEGRYTNTPASGVAVAAELPSPYIANLELGMREAQERLKGLVRQLERQDRQIKVQRQKIARLEETLARQQRELGRQHLLLFTLQDTLNRQRRGHNPQDDAPGPMPWAS